MTSTAAPRRWLFINQPAPPGRQAHPAHGAAIAAHHVRRRWPLTGRDTDVEVTVRQLLADGLHGVLLTGDVGVGKSRVVEAVLNRCVASSCHVVPITSTPADRALPFGAVHHLLPETSRSFADSTEIPQVVARKLLEVAEGRPIVLGVDDASWLDELSAAVVQHLVINAGARVLFATRTEAVGTLPVEVLRRWGRLARIDLAPLTWYQTKQLVKAALGAPVDGLTLYGLWRVTDGNPLFLREVLCGAVDNGALTVQESIVTWRNGVRGDAYLSDTAATSLETLSPEELDALRYVAYGDPTPLKVIERLVPVPVLEWLEEHRLIQLDQSARSPQVRVTHPLHAYALRARTGALRAQRIRAELAAAIMATGSDDRIRAVRWQLDAQLDVPDDEVLAASDEALLRQDVAVAEQLARQVRTPVGARHLGRALVARGEYAEAEQWLADAYRDLTDPAQRTNVAALRAVNLFWGFREPQRALEVIAEAKVALPAGGSSDLLAAEALVVVFEGRTDEAIEMVARLERHPPDDPLLATAIASLRPQLLLFTGRPAQAIVELTTNQARLPGAWPTMRAMTQACHVQALVMTGAVRHAAEAVQRYYRDAVEHGSPVGVGILALAGGICAYYQGRTEQAAQWLREARALTDDHPRFRFRETTLAISAGVAAQLGLVDEARELLARLDQANVDPSAADYGAFGEVWALVISGDRSGASAVLRRRAAEASAVGNLLMATEFLHVDMRLAPSAATATRLQQIAAGTDGELFALLADHGNALSRRDVREMNRVSAAFEQLGYRGFALEAAATGAMFGGGRETNALARRTQRLLGEHQGTWPEWLPEPKSPPVLTRREQQVSELAANGMDTAAIARALTVSTRTVENHLQRAYGKLGIHGRAELAAALAEDSFLIHR
ncbi:LuxR C-terminal-related transcriptional regulator [Micromonospora aurantiaca (nom. illeg.)]|uniref:LuxR C-terminal-related transcriptional regulator n=1 Tax=Micromonospora aurantiaca (nom. illeg.) TaxID=47850 RepID=UPI003410EDE1